MSEIQFANLSIRFGDKELLDYKELVVAAFLKDTYVRKYGKTSYHFLDARIGLVDSEDPLSLAIWGRFVKVTTLERQQYLDAGQLVQDDQSLESAPSSFFVFFVADHRLAFLPETKFAPTLGNFEGTIKRFVKDEYSKWAKDTYRRTKSAQPSYTWNDFYKEHPLPSIALVPLAAKEGIEKFVSRFSMIEQLTVYVVKRNQDMDGGALFEALVKKSEGMDAVSSRFIVKGDKGNGLDKNKTADFVSETTSGGYERVALRGRDENGVELKGSNEDFKLSVPVDTRELSDDELLKAAFKAYSDNKTAGVIKVSPRDAAALAPVLLALLPEEENE